MESFNQLDRDVQRWIYSEGWKDLRQIQKDAIPHVLKADRDIVISAATAAGKTEAAFLPALTASKDISGSFSILYISPLKALINDQMRRLKPLTEMLGVEVTAWHGDGSASQKRKVSNSPNGVLLITPESLESMLIRRSGWVKNSFKSLKYIIIDEYHAFLGFERGVQLQSLLHRLEDVLGTDRVIPRIALSATLGEMETVLESLRPENPSKALLIEATDPKENKSNIQLQLRGYLEELRKLESNVDKSEEEEVISADKQIARDLFELLRGDSNLVFANSRKRTEYFSALLSDLSKEILVPNEFYPHHGSLSKEIRFDLESRLQQESLPTTAICTMTLELGIDIGKVKSVSQVTAPFSVASLRQRLGRSGRRGEDPILRMFIAENELTVNSSLVDKLRLQLLQSMAMIRLLLIEKWFEPADRDIFHFSTLFHQILAVIAQWGGVKADRLWALLCKSGTFTNVTVDHFTELLTEMGEREMITQLHSGELVLASNGEKIVDHYTFYAVFNTPEEYRVVNNGRTIGVIPLTSFVVPQQYIIFSGKRWKVVDIDNSKKVITLEASKSGQPPKFSDGTLYVHDRIRQEMKKIFLEGEYRLTVGKNRLNYLDNRAIDLFNEGLKLFRDLELEDNYIISHKRHVYIIPWMGDRVVNTLALLLIKSGFKLTTFAGVIEVENANVEDVKEALISSIKSESLTNADLAKLVDNKYQEKYDKLLPENLLNIDYGSRAFNISAAKEWIEKSLF